jgi:hypothetical protein
MSPMFFPYTWSTTLQRVVFLVKTKQFPGSFKFHMDPLPSNRLVCLVSSGNFDEQCITFLKFLLVF